MTTAVKQPVAPQIEQSDFLAQLFRPLLTPQAAAWLLPASVDHVIAMTELGELIGYNLALATDGDEAEVGDRSRERMIRILRPSVERLIIPSLRSTKLTALRIEDALPHRRPQLLRREVEQFFDCSDDHVRRLQDRGLLTGPQLSQHGSGRLHHIDRESLLAFLRCREIHA